MLPTSRRQPAGEPNRSRLTRLRRCHSVTLPPATLSAARVPTDSVATALVKRPYLLRTQSRVDIGADMSRFSTACRLLAAHGIRSPPDASVNATFGTHAPPAQHLVSKCVCLCTLDGRLRCTRLCSLHKASMNSPGLGRGAGPSGVLGRSRRAGRTTATGQSVDGEDPCPISGWQFVCHSRK